MEAEPTHQVMRPAEVAGDLLRRLRSRISFDGGALVLMDPVTGLFSTGAVDSLPVATCHPFFRTEVEDGPRTLRRLAVAERPASAISVVSHPDDPLVRQVLQPFGYGSELRVVFRDAKAAWGGVSLWRIADRPDFGAEDVAELEAWSEPVGAELREAVLASLVAPHGSGYETRGLVVVADGAVVEASPGLGEVLHELRDPDRQDYRHLEHLTALAAGHDRFTAVIGTARGWLVAHGTPLAEGRVGITLTAAEPSRLLGARVAAAGLSTREIEVTRLLCRGHSDREIARELGVSDHTAHDHVRAVRRKLGVRSRAEVSALIFADAWFDDFLATAAVNHSG